MHCFVYILNLADRSHEIYRRQRESYEHHTINCTAKRAQTHDPSQTQRLTLGAAKKGTLNQAKQK